MYPPLFFRGGTHVLWRAKLKQKICKSQLFLEFFWLPKVKKSSGFQRLSQGFGRWQIRGQNAFAGARFRHLAIGCWLLAVSYWLLAIGSLFLSPTDGHGSSHADYHLGLTQNSRKSQNWRDAAPSLPPGDWFSDHESRGWTLIFAHALLVLGSGVLQSLCEKEKQFKFAFTFCWLLLSTRLHWT